MAEKPWWYPQLTDAEWCSRIRDDYEDAAGWDDEEVTEHYADGQKYATTWDHIGDAYAEYEPLADAYLDAETKLAKAIEALERIANSNPRDEDMFDLPSIARTTLHEIGEHNDGNS